MDKVVSNTAAYAEYTCTLFVKSFPIYAAAAATNNNALPPKNINVVEDNIIRGNVANISTKLNIALYFIL